MKILAIDTSTMLGGIAIMDELNLIAETRLNVKSTHSERLMTEIEHCLKQSSLKISDIDAFAVAIGPGSFTGLRIGLSTVKGLSYATGKPIVSVPTLDALALNFPYSRYPVCTMLDARKKEVYAALFKWEDDDFVRLINDVSVNPSELLEKLNEICPSPIPLPRGEGARGRVESVLSDDKIIFAGEGAVIYRDKIIESMGEKATFASPEKTVPSPANVASIGLKKAILKEFSEPVTLIPIYIRKSEAEVKSKKNPR